MRKRKLNAEQARFVEDASAQLLKALGLTTPETIEKEKVIKNALLTVRLTQNELDALKDIAEHEGRTMSELIRDRLPELNSM